MVPMHHQMTDNYAEDEVLLSQKVRNLEILA